MKFLSHEPTFPFLHIVRATITAHAYPVIVQCHLTYWKPKSTPTKTHDYIISAAYICDLLKMTLKDVSIWHQVKKIKKKLREKFTITATYNVVINSVSVVKFSAVRESILCYQDRWIVVLFGYPVQQLSETPWYNLQIKFSITTRITQLQQSAEQKIRV